MPKCELCGHESDRYEDDEADRMTPAEERAFQKRINKEYQASLRKCGYCGRRLWKGRERKERKCKCGAIGYRRPDMMRMFTTPGRSPRGVREGEAIPPSMKPVFESNGKEHHFIGETPD